MLILTVPGFKNRLKTTKTTKKTRKKGKTENVYIRPGQLRKSGSANYIIIFMNLEKETERGRNILHHPRKKR